MYLPYMSKCTIHILVLPHTLTEEIRSVTKGVKAIIRKSFTKEKELETIPQGLVNLIQHHQNHFYFFEMELFL